eukprot:11155350-Lingulodinium_polyedra.AAC.1
MAPRTAPARSTRSSLSSSKFCTGGSGARSATAAAPAAVAASRVSPACVEMCFAGLWRPPCRGRRFRRRAGRGQARPRDS